MGRLRRRRARYHKRWRDCVVHQAQREAALFVERYRKLICHTIEFDALRYVYVPLHYQPELTTSALGGRYADQLFVLETLSEWVPKDITLLVKENPVQNSVMRGEFFFERLRRLQNVRIVPIETSTYDLIEKAELVATVTGTAGWEALCMGKPVLAMGAAWYRELPGAFHFSANLDYEEVIRHSFSRGRLERAVSELLARLPVGMVDPAYSQLVKDVSVEANAEAVAGFLTDYLMGRPAAQPQHVEASP